jgi:hypothetical protein
MSSSAARVREFRARIRRRSMLVTIEVRNDLPDALVDSGFLAEWNAESPQESAKIGSFDCPRYSGLAIWSAAVVW